ncbi:MAG: hypothetical protein OEW83_11795 [Acidimicrobiia bacterium]|nr:hypothetical protein [Acidimicrobiia bacterium]
MSTADVLPSDLFDATTRLIVESSRTALDWFRPGARPGPRRGTALAVDNKRAAGFDPVTEADRAVERLIRDGLADLFPGHAITGEEFGISGDGRYRWFIDPVDGTRAFVTGQPMWGTLVGLTVDGEPVAGWMHLPVLDETYIGVDGATRLLPPADADGHREIVPLSTTGTTSPAEAMLLCTHPSMFAPGPELERFEALADTVKMVRFGGDCMNYGLLASGDADLVVENQLQTYDILPLIPIITGAGGVVTDLQGRPPHDGGYVVAAATPELHAAALATLRG